jgi:putative transposase
MARPLRIEFADALYHVMSRGNDHRPIVRDDADRLRRLEWLARTVETYRWRLHAFVLMSNHEHLFVETPEPNLSAGMQHLNGSYTTHFNRRHRRVGHLFQGRFKAQLVEDEGYFWEISRYIHLNPVRARLVERPDDWPWSSYPGYHRASRQVEWVTYARVLREFGRNLDQARRAYCRHVREGMASAPESPWQTAVQGLIVGREAFVERVRGLLSGRRPDRAVPMLRSLRPRPTLERIADAVAGEFATDRAAWATGRRIDDVSRAAAAWLARRRFGYRVREIAEALGYASHGGVATSLRRVETAGDELRRRLNRLEDRIND